MESSVLLFSFNFIFDLLLFSYFCIVYIMLFSYQILLLFDTLSLAFTSYFFCIQYLVMAIPNINHICKLHLKWSFSEPFIICYNVGIIELFQIWLMPIVIWHLLAESVRHHFMLSLLFYVLLFKMFIAKFHKKLIIFSTSLSNNFCARKNIIYSSVLKFAN